jgi:transposase
MDKPEFFVGIDIASASFTASAGQLRSRGWQIVVSPSRFDNTYDSFPAFRHWLQEHRLRTDNCVVCMEATGVYGEALAHFLVANDYRVAIDPPLAVKRAFKPVGHKSDPVDSQQISEYAYRYFDQLSFWQPRAQVLEQIQVLLSTREQFSAQKVGHLNALHALKRKQVRTPFAEQAHQQAIEQLKEHLKRLEQEIKRLIEQDPPSGHLVALLMTIPGVGLLLAAHLLVLFGSREELPTPRQLAAYVGICPYEYSSGSSVRAPSTSRHYGPPGLRKLIHLASMSVRMHNPQFRRYFLRKVAEGKAKRLVLNNIGNKLLKIICAIVRTDTPYIPNYRSVHPRLLKQPLTVS